MSTTVSELKQQRLNIHNNLECELKFSYKFYQENCDVDFKVEDHYFKFVLFSLYRSIEDLIYLLLVERKTRSTSKNFYELICEKNLKSFFVENPFLKIIFDDIQITDIEIKYIEMFHAIKNEVLSNTSIKVQQINEIKPSSSNKNDSVNIDNFFQIFKNCRDNRNKMMHSITDQIDLTKNSIINAFIVYTFFDLLLEKILVSK